MGRILVVDDDTGILRAFSALLMSSGHEITTASSGEEALETLAREHPEVVVMDVWLPGMDGLATFRKIKSSHPQTPVIVITGTSTMDLAIEASKLGAFEYQLKPFDPSRMLQIIEHALESVRLVRMRDNGGSGLEPPSGDFIIGQSPRMQEVYKEIGRVTATDATVLIRGESGTGKELVAKAIHQHSQRGQQSFVVVNCVAIPETLLESELFGFERGAFTGATARRLGMFERADGGTILLDEVGDVPLGVQAKILRVLQERTFERVGGNETIRVDVRILAATNRDMEQAILQGRFREDLYHRLDVVTIHLPPLRERRDDIPALVSSFLSRFAVELKIERPAISPDAMELLCSYAWPGNVRELEHCLKRALIHSRGFPIQRGDLRRALEGGDDVAGSRPTADGEAVLRDFVRGYLARESGPGCEPKLMETVERELLLEALRRSQGNQSRAAELLGIPRPTLHAKLQRHGIRTTGVVEHGKRQAQG